MRESTVNWNRKLRQVVRSERDDTKDEHMVLGIQSIHGRVGIGGVGLTCIDDGKYFGKLRGILESGQNILDGFRAGKSLAIVLVIATFLASFVEVLADHVGSLLNYGLVTTRACYSLGLAIVIEMIVLHHATPADLLLWVAELGKDGLCSTVESWVSSTGWRWAAMRDWPADKAMNFLHGVMDVGALLGELRFGEACRCKSFLD